MYKSSELKYLPLPQLKNAKKGILGVKISKKIVILQGIGIFYNVIYWIYHIK